VVDGPLLRRANLGGFSFIDPGDRDWRDVFLTVR